MTVVVTRAVAKWLAGSCGHEASIVASRVMTSLSHDDHMTGRTKQMAMK